MQSYASRIHINEKNVGFSIDHGFQTIFLLLTPPLPSPSLPLVASLDTILLNDHCMNT